MRIAVFSDSHRDTAGMYLMIRRLSPDTVFHLGDLVSDAALLREAFPDIPLYSVAGNNDSLSDAPQTVTLTLEGVKLILTHGHAFGVHAGPDRLQRFAAAQGAQAALFGHTHAAFCEQRGGVWLLNPGRAGKGLFSLSPATCGLLTLAAGSLDWECIEIEEN